MAHYEEPTTVTKGTVVYSSEKTYVGKLRDRIVFGPKQPLENYEFVLYGNPIFGGEFTLNAGYLDTRTPFYIVLSCDFLTALRQASNAFRTAPGNAIPQAEVRRHELATELIERINAQTFALLRKIRGVRHDAVRQFGELSPEEEEIIGAVTAQMMEALQVSVATALATIAGDDEGEEVA